MAVRPRLRSNKRRSSWEWSRCARTACVASLLAIQPSRKCSDTLEENDEAPMTNDELNPNDETRNGFGRSTSDPSSFGLCHFFAIRHFLRSTSDHGARHDIPVRLHY